MEGGPKNINETDKEKMILDVVETLKKGEMPSNILSIPNEIIKSPDMKEAAIIGLINQLKNGNIYSANVIKKKFSIPDVVIKSPKVQNAATEGVVKAIKNNFEVENAVKIIEDYFIPEKILKSVEVQKAATEVFIKRIKVWGFASANNIHHFEKGIEIKEKFFLPETIVQKAATDVIIEHIKDGYLDDAIFIKEKFAIPDEVIESAEAQKAAIEGIIINIKNGNLDDAIKIIEKLAIPDVVIKSPEVQKAATEGIIYKIKEGYTNRSIEIKEKFFVPDETIKSLEVQKAATEGIIKEIKSGFPDRAIEIKEKFFVPDAGKQSTEIQLAAIEKIIKDIKDGGNELIRKVMNGDNTKVNIFDEAIKIKEKFAVSESEVQMVVIKEIIKLVKYGYPTTAIKIKEKFSVPDSVITSPEVQKAAIEGIIEQIKYDHLDHAIKIKEMFAVPSESSEVQKIAVEAIIKQIRHRYLDQAIKIKENFFVPESTVQMVVIKKIIELVKDGYYLDQAIKIKEMFFISDEVIKSPEVQKAAIEGITKEVEKNNLDDAIKIKENFFVPDSVITSPEVQKTAIEGIVKVINEGLTVWNNRNVEGYINEINKIKKNFFIQNESSDVQEAVIQKVINEIEKNHLDDAIKIKEQLSVPNESPEIQRFAIETIAKLIKDTNNNSINNIDDTIKIKEKFAVPNESPEVQKIAVEGIIYRLQKDEYYNAIKIKEKFAVPDEMIKSPEVQKAAVGAIIKEIYGFSPIQCFEIKDKFFITDEIIKSPEIQKVVIEKIIKDVRNGYLSDLIKIKEKFFISDSVLKSPEVQRAAVDGIVSKIKEGNNSIGVIIKIKETFLISDEVIKSPEVQHAVIDRFIREIKFGNLDMAIEIKECLFIPDEVIKSSEIQKMVSEGIVYKIKYGDYVSALKINEKFAVSDEVIKSPEVQKAVVENIISQKINNRFDFAIEIKNKIFIQDEVLYSPEVQLAIISKIFEMVAINRIDDAMGIIRFFSISEKFIKSYEVQKKIITLIIKSYFEDSYDYMHGVNAQLMKKYGFLTEDYINLPEIQKIIQEAIITSLSISNDYEEYDEPIFVGLVNCFNLTDDFFSSPAMQKIANEKILNFVTAGDMYAFTEIKKVFHINLTAEQIIEKIPTLKTFIERMKLLSPDFVEQINKSDELLFSVATLSNRGEEIIKLIENNPFLLDAIKNNTQFGSRLLTKYIEFDQYSKENISTLFDVKKKIISANPDIDPESVEFRILMQESLMDFKDNKKIIAEIEKSGIKSQEWLNYEETANFSLNSAEGTLSFAETVQTPLNRIKETIGSYSNKIKEVLKQYIEELKKAQIPIEDASQIQAQIQKMESELEKAKAEGNDRKVQGIEKGLLGMRKKLETIKTVSAWEKILSDISGFEMLKNDISSAQEKLIEAERQIYEAMSEKEPSGKKIAELKKILGDAKRDFQDKFVMLGKRITNFKESLLDRISPLGKERAESLIQEIEQALVEQFNHYNTDKDTLQSLFGEKMEKDKEVLESRPMSIFVWARNPDIDLYQGNYSPCCICIDSAHMGAESTIADYATDLGVQIVNIWDETTQKPVTAAWCWIGKDEAGKPALVVDNIESNTLYSSNYSEQISNELFDYIKQYAKSIGVGKVVLGKANNDLPAAGVMSKMKDNEKTFTKLGGANRADSYFLEAEEENVKVIWDKRAKAEKKASVEEKAKIRFNDVSVKAVENADFDSIKKLEKIIYSDDLAIGQEMIEELKHSNGTEYSFIVQGIPEGKTETEPIGYLVATEDETDEGEPSVYLDDIAVLPEAQKQGIGWKMFKMIIETLKAKAQTENQPILFDMHLRDSSRMMLDKHTDDLKALGVETTGEAFVPDHYDEGDDALYRIYKVNI